MLRKNLYCSVSSGQIALIVLTIMGVVLTLGLSLSSRVLTDIEVSEKEQESARAFSAAEAGIEEALKQLSQGETAIDIDPSDLGVDSLDVDLSVSGESASFVHPKGAISPGDTVIIWLCNHDSTTGDLDEANYFNEPSINVCWESSAAVEVIYFYDIGASDYRIGHYAIDSDDARRTSSGGDEAGNNFSNVDLAATNCAGLDVGGLIDLSLGEPLFLAIRPLYAATRVGAERLIGSSEEIPAQGYEIYSTGEVEEGAEIISRRIRVFRGWNTPTAPFFNALFSGTSGISGN